MIDTVVELSKINPYKKVNEITREERMNLVKLLKNFTITISGFRPIEEGIVTSGGINVKEIKVCPFGDGSFWDIFPNFVIVPKC